MATIAAVNAEFDKAVAQVIKDSERLHTVINGDATADATAEDGSKLPSVRKALVENLYFKTPLIPWTPGQLVREFNQLYLYTDADNISSWWFAPGATQNKPVTMRDSPVNDRNFRVVIFSKDGSLYAPVTSPDFKGNPRTPTPAQGDSSTSIANTEYVQRELDNLVNNPLGSDISVKTITVGETATIRDVNIGGQTNILGSQVSATNANVKAKSLTLTAADSSISVDPSVSVPVNKKKTSVTVTSITTDELVSSSLTSSGATIGSRSAVGTSNTLLGKTVADTVVIGGSAGVANSLEVSGLTVLDRLKVNSGVEGINISVDGEDIHPRSVSTTASMSVGGNAAVQGTMDIVGKATVRDLDVLGTVTGFTPTIDGVDIRPNSVRTVQDVTVGRKLTVSGTTELTGNTTVNNLTVNGVLTATVDLTGKDISVRNITAGGDTQLNTLTTAGAFTAAGSASAKSLTVTDSAVIGSMEANRVLLHPETITTSAATWTPSGDSNIYNVKVTQNITVAPPTGLLASGESASIFYFLEQDDIGGHTVTFAPEYVKIGGVDISTVAGAMNIVQLIYRGTGNIIDMIVTTRP